MDNEREKFKNETYDQYNIPLYTSEAKQLLREKEEFIQKLVNPDNPTESMGITLVSFFFLIVFLFVYVFFMIFVVIAISAIVKLVQACYSFLTGGGSQNIDYLWNILGATIMLLLFFYMVDKFRV